MTCSNNTLTLPIMSPPYHPSHTGILIPSPRSTHTHALIPHPFNPSTLFSKENFTAVLFPAEYCIDLFPLEEQARMRAGQVAVVREMRALGERERLLQRDWMGQGAELVLDLERGGMRKRTGTKKAVRKELSDKEYWRAMLGWAGSADSKPSISSIRYVTSLPTRTTTLRDHRDKYVWDHALGEWKAETWAGLIEHDRREHVCREMERIDELRYVTEERWARDIERELGKRKPKRSTPNPLQFAVTDEEVLAPKRVRKSDEVPDSQTSALSSFSCFEKDAEHETRSQAPEPEIQPQNGYQLDFSSLRPLQEFGGQSHSSTSSLSTDFQLPITLRYPFLLDITEVGDQRREWVEFLEGYGCNGAMIGALRRFFCGWKGTRSAAESVRFLERLRTVCERIVEVDGAGNGDKGQRRGRRYLFSDVGEAEGAEGERTE